MTILSFLFYFTILSLLQKVGRGIRRVLWTGQALIHFPPKSPSFNSLNWFAFFLIVLNLLADYQSDIVAKIKAEATLLRHTNEDLCKQVEGLQMSRLNEVEELAYLRWVNSCLRSELRNSCSTMNSDKPSSPHSIERSAESVGSFSSRSNEYLECNSAKRLNLIKKLKKWPITDEDLSNLESPDILLDKSWVDLEELRSPRRRHSISGSKCCAEELVPNKRRQSDCFVCTKDMEKEVEPLTPQTYELGIIQRAQVFGNGQEANKISVSFDVEKRALRVPNPPPRPTCFISSGPKEECNTQIPPPPPPPPPPPKFAVRSTAGMVKRAPQVVEFYHSLMKRDSRKDSSNGGICDVPDVANVRSSMIGEIENRSSHLLAVSVFSFILFFLFEITHSFLFQVRKDLFVLEEISFFF